MEGGLSDIGHGQGGLEVVTLRHKSGATAEVYLWGATVCSYKTPDGKEQIFCSPKAVFDGKKAIRGGVPMVFPQFGQADKAMAQHGFARVSFWKLSSLVDKTDESRAVLTLEDSSETRKQWGHQFSLEYIVSLTASALNLTLRITNTGPAAFDFNALLHTYLRIPDIEDARVCGLAGRQFIDKTRGEQSEMQTESEVALPRFTDRVYAGDKPEVAHVVVKSSGTAILALENRGSIAGKAKEIDIVVWNPYEEASPGDLPPPAYREFVCVEPGLVGSLHQLRPGQQADVGQKITPV